MRVLLVTNDFPPTIGGIQSYLRDFINTLPPQDVVVFASTQDAAAAVDWDGQAAYRVYRWPRRVMLPTPATARRMQQIIRAENIDVVWFGAAAPLALMARAARAAGARRVVASTHGHEVGWSMLPGARQMLRLIGSHCDVVTYISDYTLSRFRAAFGEPTFEWLPSGVDSHRFSPLSAVQRQAVRSQLGWRIGGHYVVCISRLVPRKGQDQLVRLWPDVLTHFPDATLVIVGGGSRSFTAWLRRLAGNLADDRIIFTGRVGEEHMSHMLHAADVFAMPCRTRGGGLDVEGLGIVYLEAQAAGIPVIAGRSGGAPETVTPESGIVVDGRSQQDILAAIVALLSDPKRCAAMGRQGRSFVEQSWTWERMGARLRRILAGPKT
ncbi:MAG: glycosyltransferase family 4 protein [Corynebacterium matruchotii]|uniref:glycosyltransferase family 4 protein n=1 Tax=Corynebacterium matruchotii TaxID=43768 RepID=UPI00361971C9